MSNLIITRPPQFLDPWFTEIEQVWDEVETSVNDNDTRISTLEVAIISDVVTSISKSGEAQIQGDATFTGTGAVSLTQAGQNIAIGVDVSLIDHGSLLPASLLDDDHTQYILAAGTRAFSGNQSFGNFQATSFRVENVAIVPGAGQQGRLIFDVPNLALKVDDGTTFKNVGVTDHGLLDAPSLLDDDHPQYLLVDGTRAVTGDFTVNGKYINEASEPMTLESQEADGASAVAFVMDTASALNTAGALLLSVRNNGSEIFTIDKDGFITGGLSSKTSLYALIDTDNDSSIEKFSVESNSITPGGGTVLFTINEAGEGNFPIAAGIRIGSPGVPSDMLDVDGAGDISGNLALGGDLNIVGAIKSLSNMIFQIDSDDDESATFEWQNGTGGNILSLDESGDLTVVGTLIGGASSFTIESKETDSGGPTAGAFILDTQNTLTNPTSKLLSVQNNGVEKWFVTIDGVSSEMYVKLVRPSEGDAGIEAAINTVSAAGGGIVQLLEGTYVVDAGINPNNTIENVIIQGVGPATILESDGIYSDATLKIEGQSIQSVNINNITRGDTSVTCTTVAEAGNVLEGDILFIHGLDGDSLSDQEAHEVAADGNPTTGVIALKGSIAASLTTATCRNNRGSRNIMVRDLKISAVTPIGGAHAINLRYTTDCTIENVEVENIGGSNGSGAFDLEFYGVRNAIRNCKAFNCEFGILGTRNQISTSLVNCKAVNVALGNISATSGAITIGYGSTDTLIDGNEIDGTGEYGIYMTGSNPNNIIRRVSIINNKIKNTGYAGMIVQQVFDSQIENNSINQPGQHGVRLQWTYDCIFRGNILTGTGSPSIYIWHNENLIVDGNHVKDSQASGISHESGDIINCTFSNNIIDGTGLQGSNGFGMYLGFGAGSIGCIISNNIIKNCVTADWTGRGIYINNGIGFMVINNYIDDCSGTGMSISGITDSIVTGNNINGEGFSYPGAGSTAALNKE